ncbi:MAG: O-acetylhomoserine aminocarboxypropyltransferase/cysteine synthase family protein [Candidatus Limiplasma sp.]|nr:O-acetylhomoserine aminocarboxypropyltransferase/cysteine synthase family protein [Candidatus Limiplasma sp.]
MSQNPRYAFDTLQLHAGQRPDSQTHSRAMPIYQTTSYCYPSAENAAQVFHGQAEGFTYTRIDNPTVAALEERVTALEQGKGSVAFASGMAAVTALVYALCGHSDHIVSISTLYGGTHTLLNSRLPQISNIHTTFVPPDDLDALEAAIRPNTRIIYLETLCNPRINIPDFEGIKAIAQRHGVVMALDNTFGIPPMFDAKAWGVDVVIHSLSKYAGGHGTTIGGAVVDLGGFDFANGRYPAYTEPDPLHGGLVYAREEAPVATRLRMQMLREMGGCLSPFGAFLILQGLETLSLRVKRHCENALTIARWLSGHPAVEYVYYPMLPGDPYHQRARKYLPLGAGAILSFGVKGGFEAGRKFIDHLNLFSLLANVADAKSLVIHPASTTHGQMNEAELKACGVAPELIRLSIGLEDPVDLIADLETALAASQEKEEAPCL